MWDCSCGCRRIAGSVAACPMCGKENDQMPTITSAGPSNAWEGQDPAEPETAATDVQDPAPVTPEPEPAADSKPEPAVEAPAPPPTSVFEARRTAAAPGPVEDGDKP